MSTIDPSLLNSIFSVTYSYGPDPGDTVSYTRARINIGNVHTLAVDTLTYSNIDFGDASGNLFVGAGAGCNVTLTSNCTGLGEQSMEFLTQGSNATGVGFASLRNTASLTRVVAVGTYAGDSNSNVADTVIIGDLAARGLSNATSNVIIGSGAGTSLTGGTNNILIGAGVNPVTGSNNNIFNLGNTLFGTTAGSLSTASGMTVRGTLLVSSNIGVYTSAPRVALDISGQGATVLLGATLPSTADGLLVQGYADTGYIRSLSSDGALFLGVSDNNIVRIRYGGVGINTPPVAPLHVSGTVIVHSANASSTNIAWRTNADGASPQAYTMFLADTDGGIFSGNQRQMLAYVYPVPGASTRGGTIPSYRVLLSDQALVGLSAGDLYVDNTLQASQLLATNVSASTFAGTNLSIAGTISTTTFVGNGTIPVGGIILWSGSVASIPVGWALCDGTNGTPNLTNQFIIGAGGTYAVGISGGSTTQTLAVSNIPPHRHSGYVGPLDAINSGGNAAQNTPAWGGGSDTNNSNYTSAVTISSAIYDPAGNLVLSGSATPASFSILPPFYALAYIMRTV
jgi:hypothetical protein